MTYADFVMGAIGITALAIAIYALLALRRRG
jgi:hypothetical protein